MSRKERVKPGLWLLVLAVASFAGTMYYMLNAIESIRMFYGNR